MAIDPAHLRQHLERAAAAYGCDATLPVGRATPRPQLPPPSSAEPRAVAATPPPAATPAAADPGMAAPNPATPPARPTTAAAAPTPAPTAHPRAAAPSPVSANPIAANTAAASPVAASPAAGSPAGTPASDPGDAAAALAALRLEVLPCTRCKLHQGRRHTVFGEGNPRARVMFIGEAPGAVEDQTGRPFVGPAGQLLDRIISGAMGLQRGDVFIANINKCRPPDNREPQPDEVAACLPYLQQQVAIVQPEVIVCLGRTAAQNLLGTTLSTTALRGRELRYRDVPVVVTWHPAYLLRDPSHKRETWDDIKRVNRLLGLPDTPAGPAGA